MSCNVTVQRKVERAAAGGTGSPGAQVDHAIELLQALIADVEAAITGAAADDDGADNGQADPPEELGHVRVALAELTRLRDSGSASEMSRAAGPIIAAFEGPSPDAAAPTGNGAVQRAPAAAAAPLVAAGPPGWAALGVLAVGSLILLAVASDGSRTRTRTRAQPRAIPRRPSMPSRGRIQVQGEGGRLDMSYPWSRPAPMTKAEALAGLAGLKVALTATQLKLRSEAFAKAAKFISSTLVVCPPFVSRSFQNSNLPNRDKDARVDIEIWSGTAFI